MMKYAVRTDRGKRRSNNEDSYLILTEGDRAVFAVADGMGGANGGEVASQLTVKTLQNALTPIKTDTAFLRFALQAANRRVYETAREKRQYQGMGTTLSLMLLDGMQYTILHVGDSRVYRLRGGQMNQLTEDHSYVGELMRLGVITPAEARTHPYRNVITRAVGTDVRVEEDLLSGELLSGDRCLICSDGLHSMVEDAEIESILRDHLDTESAAEALLRAALDAGGDDNVTLIVLDAEGEDEA